MYKLAAIPGGDLAVCFDTFAQARLFARELNRICNLQCGAPLNLEVVRIGGGIGSALGVGESDVAAAKSRSSKRARGWSATVENSTMGRVSGRLGDCESSAYGRGSGRLGSCESSTYGRESGRLGGCESSTVWRENWRGSGANSSTFKPYAARRGTPKT